MRTITGFVLFAFLSASAAAQPYSDGWFVPGTGHLHYADPFGVVNSVSHPGGSAYAAVMNWDNATVAVYDSSRNAILKVDPMNLTVVGTFFSHPSLTSSSAVTDMAFDANGDLFYGGTSPAGIFKTSEGAAGFTTVTNSGVFSTGCGNLSIDPDTGELLATKSFTAQREVYRVARDGMAVTTLGTGIYTRYGTYKHPVTGDIFSGSCCTNGGGSNGSVMVLPNGQSVGTIFVASTQVRGAYAPRPERASAASPSLVTSTWRDTSTTGADGLWRIDLQTQNFTKLATITTGNTYKAVPVFGRNLQTVRASRGIWAARVSFPQYPGRPYAIAFSASGIRPPVILPDGRLVCLVLDDLARLSLNATLAPFVTNNFGNLSAGGTGGATINLTSLGSVVNGVTIYMVAVVLEPSAPSGIAVISDPKAMLIEGV